ncbi:MAG TPA: SRPBCC domain-containing protein [Anaerolineales bacterium]|nr:SRPBCC domain-containing protein [Anaerolineales bacterium]
MNQQSISFTQKVKASPAEVYSAFTNATALREWLSDVASALPKPGGRLYLAWNSGYYASGEFTELQPGERAAFTWQGRGEPAQSRVQVRLSAQDGLTQVDLDHTGLGTGAGWEKASQEIEYGWKTGLENLASVLETGEDLRFTLRPMLGILVGVFDEEKAKELGVPVSQGIRLDEAIDGMGAKAAGLRKDDVVVGMAGFTVTDFPSLTVALQKQRGGDQVKVEFYRGGEKTSSMMQLSKRPVPEIPATAEALAQAVQKKHAEIQAELDKTLAGVSEAQASFKPGPVDWSLKGVLAHLIQGERGWHSFISDLINGQERVSDDYGDNVNAVIEATVAAYSTLEALRAEYRQNQAETVQLLARLPEKFMARKGSYWRLAYYSLEDDTHNRLHTEQMAAALQAARAAGVN